MINWDLTAGTLQHCQCQQIPVNVGRFDDIPTEESEERTLAAIITTKNSSELLTQLFKISKRNPKQTNYRNLRRNYWSCPSGIIWKPKHLRLSNMTDILATSLFLSNTISYNFVLIILKCFSHNDFLPTKKCSPKKAEIFRNVYIINFHI